MKHTLKFFVPVFLSASIFAGALLYTAVSGTSMLRAQVDEDAAAEQPLELADEAKVLPDKLVEAGVISGDSVSCSEYYPGDQLRLNLETSYASYAAGDPVMIRGTVKNDSTLSLSRVDVVARLMREQPEDGLVGPAAVVVDEFKVAEGLALGAGENYALSGNYLLPLNMPAGTYEVRLFAYYHGRFDLAGSASSNVSASILNFDVTGGAAGTIYFNQAEATVNGAAYAAESVAVVPGEEAVEVSVPLENSTGSERTVTLTYELHSSESVGAANLVETKKQNVRVPAAGTVVTYSVPAAKLPGYILKITAVSTDPSKGSSVFLEKSVATVRFAKADGLSARLAFVGLEPSGFAGSRNVRLTTCFGAQSEDDNLNVGKVETILLDDQGNQIGRLEYAGSIPVALSALSQSFDVDRAVPQYVVESRIYDAQGTIIDQFKDTYGCADLGEGYCAQPKSYANLIFGLIALIIIVVVGYFSFVRKDSSINNLKV